MTKWVGISGKALQLTAFIVCAAVAYFLLDSTLQVNFQIQPGQIPLPRILDETAVVRVESSTARPPVTAALGVLQRANQTSKSNTTVGKSGTSSLRKQTVLSDKKIVLVVAYMRTGSTLTASLFQEYPNSFYAFEPIRSIHEAFTKVKKTNNANTTSVAVQYLHSLERTYNESEMNKVQLDEINSWLTCRLDKLSVVSLTDSFHKAYTKIMKHFYFCYKQSAAKVGRRSNSLPVLRRYYDNTKAIDACLKDSMTACQNSSLIILKFIRLPMRDALKLLPFYPNMKIIHLVRDPRGIINSRFSLKVVKTGYYESAVTSFCKTVNNDLVYTKKMFKEYPGRVKILHYEDMAENPVEMAKEIVKFSGINITKAMLDYIESQTSAKKDSCAYCTQRKNSTTTAYKWRTQLPFVRSSYVYEKCKLSNKVLGYLPLSSERQQKELTKPSRKVLDTRKVLLTDDKF